MDAFQKEIDQLTGTDFFQLAKREPHPRVRTRLLALGHLQSGKTKTDVVGMFRITFPTLRTWMLQFIAKGIDGLKPQQGRGRKRKLPAAQEENFRRQIEELQQDRKGGRIRIDCRILVHQHIVVDHVDNPRKIESRTSCYLLGSLYVRLF
jgi:transposase